MPQREAHEGIREIEAMIAQARQCLLAGPAASDAQRRNLASVVSERLPRAVERLQRQSMSTATARRAAGLFALVQDFVDTCLRSPSLGEEGPLRLDLTPLLYVLRILVTAEPVPPRYISPSEPTGVVPPNYFNRDHGKPLLREFFGRSVFVWPDDDRAARVDAGAIGWVIDILDVHGQLARQLQPDPPPPPAGTAVSSQGSSLASDKWHRLRVSGLADSSEVGGEDPDAGGAGREQRPLEGKGGGVAGVEVGLMRDSSPPLFVLTSSNGGTAFANLSDFSIKWVPFQGTYEDDRGTDTGETCGGGRVDGRDERKGKARAHRSPPGFGSGTGALTSPDGGLTYGSAEVGTRIDVWWSRYNSYYRATIEGYDAACRTHKLVYDDGEIRDTDMSKRGFLICERPGPGGRSVSSSGKADPGGTSHHSAKKAAWTPLGLDERMVIGRRKLSSMAPRPPAEYARDASAYVIEAVSRLGEAGGVAPLANRISEGGGRASFGEVLETFRMDKALRTHASAKAIKEVHWILKECAAAAMLSVPPESMRAATKAEIAECISCVRDLAMAGVRASHPPHELMQEIEQLELAMAMKVFRCPSLERRLAGLMHICGLVKLAEQREAVTKLDASATPGEGRRTAWVTAEAMERWLVEVGFVEELFGSSMHVELAKRSEPILTFLAKRNAVSTSQLDLLWSSTLGKHEAVVRVMRTVVVNLVPFLSPHKRLHLFSCVARTPFYKYTEQTLHLVYQFTVKALEAHRTTKSPAGKGADEGAAGAHAHASNASSHGHSQTTARPAADDSSSGTKGALRRGQVLHCREWEWEGYGYDLLWMFVQDSSEEQDADDRSRGGGGGGSIVMGKGNGRVSAELTSLAAGYLVSLLKEPEVAQELWPLVTRCVENVVRRRSVPSSLEVLRRAVGTLPAHEVKSWFGGSRSKENSVPGALEALQRNQKLLPAVLEELEDYHRSVASYYGRVNRGENMQSAQAQAYPASAASPKQKPSLVEAMADGLRTFPADDGSPDCVIAVHEKGRNGAPPAAVPESAAASVMATATSAEFSGVDAGLTPDGAFEGDGEAERLVRGGSASVPVPAPTSMSLPASASVSTLPLTAKAQAVLNHGCVKAFGVGTRYNHLQHLKARLEFLMFALTNSNLGLSEAHVDLVWRVLVEEALTPEAADLALVWLRQACATVGDAALSTSFFASGGGGVSGAGSGGGSRGGTGGAFWSNPALAKGSKDDGPTAAAGSSWSFAGVIGPLPALPEASLTHLFEEKLGTVSFDRGARSGVAVLFGLLFVHVNSRTKAIRPYTKTTSSVSGASSANTSSIATMNTSGSTNTTSSGGVAGASGAVGGIGGAAAAAASGSALALAQGTAGAAGGGWVRHAMDLEGLDMLWDIVLNASGSRASLAASELVVELHRRLGPKLKPKIAKIGAGFVDTCLGHLRAAVSRVTKRRAELAPAATEDGGIVDGSVDVGDEGVGVGGIGGEAVADEAGVAESEEAPLGFQGKPMSMRSGTRSGARHHVRTPRSSSLPPEKPFQVKRGGIPRARGVGRRAASVEGRDLSRAEELERARAAARDAGRHARSPRAEIAARRRRVGRCIMLLAKFVDRANEEENVHRVKQAAVVRVNVQAGAERLPVLEMRLPGSATLGELRSEVARRFRVPAHWLELFREVRRKGNTIAEKLEEDEASLEAAGLVATGLASVTFAGSTSSSLPNATPPDAASSSSSLANSASAISNASAAAAAAATGVANAGLPAATAATMAGTAPALASVEVLARIVGEIPSGSDGAQRGERKKEAAIGGDSGGSSTVTSDTRSGGDEGSSSQGAEPPFPPDLIGMEDLQFGWMDDEIPSRWPSLTAPAEQRVVVIMLSRGRRRRRVGPPSSPYRQQADEAIRQSVGGAANAVPSGWGAVPAAATGGPADTSEVVETGFKRLSFRRPSMSSSGARTIVRPPSLSSSPFSLSTRRGRRSQRAPQVEEHSATGGGGGSGGAATVAVSEQEVDDTDAAGVQRSLSPSLPSAAGGLREAPGLEALLPDWRDMRAPPPPPLPPPLPHKANMVLIEPLASPPSSLSPSSSHFLIGDGLAGGSGSNGGGPSSANGGGGGGSGGGSALTSLPSLSSLLASAQGGRGPTPPAVGGQGEPTSGAVAVPSSGGSAGDHALILPAEVVGEPQHMDQLFDMLDLDLGLGTGMGMGEDMSVEKPEDSRAELDTGARRRDARSKRLQEETATGSLRGAVDGAQRRHIEDSGSGDEVHTDYLNASLWHILQSLPVDRTVVRDLRSLRKVETSWNAVLDPRRCYRFVYALQVVDAFCTSRANLSGPKAVEALLTWSIRFCSLGGVDHLVSSLKVVFEAVNVFNEAEMRYARASRLEAWTLSAALVTRVLHRLLQLDAAFFHGCAPEERWPPAALFHSANMQHQQQQRPMQLSTPAIQTKESSGRQETGYSLPKDGNVAREGHPPQPSASTFALQLESIGKGILSDAMNLLLSLLRQSAPAKPLLSAVAHVLTLVGGLAGGFGGGTVALERHPALGSLLRALCFRVPNTAVRRMACAVLYRASHWQALGRDASSIAPDEAASEVFAEGVAASGASSTTTTNADVATSVSTAVAPAAGGGNTPQSPLRRNRLACILLAQLQVDLARVQAAPFARGGVAFGLRGGLSPVRRVGSEARGDGNDRTGTSLRDGSEPAPLVVPRPHLVEVTAFVAGLVHVVLQQGAPANSDAATMPKPAPLVDDTPGARAHPSSGPLGVRAIYEQTSSSRPSLDRQPPVPAAGTLADATGDREGIIAGTGLSSVSFEDAKVVDVGAPGTDGGEAAQAAASAEWLLDFASRQLAAHEFTETFKSDAADHLLVSLLHALTVAVSGSSVRKRRAESIFLSLASPPAPPCSSFSSAPPARGTSLSFSSPPPPRWGLLRFLYEGCLFPAAPTEPSLSSSTPSSAAEGTAAAKLAKPTKAAVAESSLGPRCKKKETRSAAFTLLSTLCRGEEDHLRETFGLLGGRDLVSRAAPAATTEAAATSAAATAGGGDGAEVEGTAPGTVSIVPSVDSVSGVDVDVDEASAAASGEPWDYDPTSVLKESGQHVGLQNQGATCYMNSLLQQLYHVPDFSLPLLGLAPDRAVTRASSGDNSGGLLREEEGVLLQLQVLFASLRISQRKFYDTKPFCAVFMDYDGQPLRHAEQKDVNEFCIHLMHKLERSSGDAGKLIQRVFGGTLVYQIISRDCVHTSEKTEPFLVLTAEVQDKDSLEGSLQLLVAGEMLTGDNCYMCEKCGQRVTAQRRCAIKELPSTLIVHLKRFEFDLSTMSRHKLNHRCSFPLELDMSPWTLQTLERQDNRLSAGSDGGFEAAAAAPTTKDILSEAIADKDDGLDSRVCLDSDLCMVPPSTSASVTGNHNVSGEDEEEGKEAEPLSGGTSTRSPVPGQPIVDGTPSAAVNPSSDERRENATAGGRVGSSVGDGDGNSSAGGAGEDHLGEVALETDRYSVAALGRGVSRTGYRLKGIVAHQGTADHGHFYSLIRTDGDQWLEFNDRRVTPYDPANIPRDCFGGGEPGAPQNGVSDASTSAGTLHETNAYLLLYERATGFSDGRGRHGLEPSTVLALASSWRENSVEKTTNSRQDIPRETVSLVKAQANVEAGKEAAAVPPGAVPTPPLILDLMPPPSFSERDEAEDGPAERANAAQGPEGNPDESDEFASSVPGRTATAFGAATAPEAAPAVVAPSVATPAEEPPPVVASAAAAVPGKACAVDEYFDEGRFADENGGGGSNINGSRSVGGENDLSPAPQALEALGGKQGPLRGRMKSRREDSADWSWSSDLGAKREVYMSAEVLDQVWTAEMAFLRDMYLLDADFFRFVWNLLQQPEAEAPRTATVAVHAGTKIAVEMVAHARASSCVPPWCRRLSELAGAHRQAAENALALLSTGRREGSKTGYLRELLVSCPRSSTRIAFERLVADAFASADPEGEPVAATCRVLLGLLDEESFGSARGASPGGLTHIAAAVAAAATVATATGGSERSILIAGQAIPRLLRCLKARRASETSAMAAASGTSAVAAIQLYHVGGFVSVVRAVERLLAGAGAVEEALGGPEGVAAVTDKQFLLAALHVCPDETGNLLAHLMWRGSSRTDFGGRGGGERAGVVAQQSGGEDVEDKVVFPPTAGGDAGLCGDGAAQQQIGERALGVLLGIVLDARKASDVGVGVAAATQTTVSSRGAAVDLGVGMNVLSRVLHLRDVAVQDRLEVALGRLAASVVASDEEGGGAGAAYLTGKLVTSLFVHVPEARPVLSRMSLLFGPR